MAWVEESFGRLLDKYCRKDNFSADETGLFFKMLPNKMLAFKGQLYHSGK